jgi:hypothetical protein
MITIIDAPYRWAIRGQKLMIIASSDETANTGFRYGIDVTIDSKVYTFTVAAAPDGNLYFDLQPLLDDMRNYEPLDWHFKTNDTYDDLSAKYLDFTLSEYWIVDGVLTQAEGSEVNGEETICINGYFQVLDGYKPDVETGNREVRQSLINNQSYAMSDRKYNTHNPNSVTQLSLNFTNNPVYIPCFESDYGLLSIPATNTYLSNNYVASVAVVLTKADNTFASDVIILNGYDIEALPVYPANLNDWSGFSAKPSSFPNWKYYSVVVLNGIVGESTSYIFYNAGVYGQKDCRYDNVRLGWVNSRGGWDYFNFIKKSETTDEIDRKKYRKVLFNSTTSVFNANNRGLTERRNLVQQVMNITSDFIQESEFLFLRSLLASNQVSWITERNGSPIAIPVNLDDTSYVEKKTRDGKLYNLTLKVRMANEYWT